MSHAWRLRLTLSVVSSLLPRILGSKMPGFVSLVSSPYQFPVRPTLLQHGKSLRQMPSIPEPCLLPFGCTPQRIPHSIPRAIPSRALCLNMQGTNNRREAKFQRWSLPTAKPRVTSFHDASRTLHRVSSAAGNEAKKDLPPRRLCVAPMMDWTDRFDRYFLRLFSKHTWLYTEMITTGALIHGDSHRHLRFDAAEHPVAVQLGGSEPEDLAKCAKMCEEYGYDEINLNVGCPSERVSSGSFGACLMAEPSLVAECLAAMADATALPVTIKHRIGIDDKDDYEHLYDFVSAVHEGAPQTKTLIVHARTAILKGLSPKQNREIPPLKYDFVHRLKQDFPHLEIIINGGINDLEHAHTHLDHVDGVMIGRAAYNTPFQVLGEADRVMYGGQDPPKTRQQILEAMLPFLEAELAAGTSLNSVTRHMLGLFHGCKGGKAFRRHLSDHVHKPDAGIHTLLAAVEKVPLEVREGLVPDNFKGSVEEHLSQAADAHDAAT